MGKITECPAAGREIRLATHHLRNAEYAVRGCACLRMHKHPRQTAWRACLVILNNKVYLYDNDKDLSALEHTMNWDRMSRLN